MQAILKHELMPVPPSLADIMSHAMRTGNKSLTDFLTERDNHTSRKCCFAYRWLIPWLQLLENQKKQTIWRVFELPRGLCVTERIWTTVKTHV